MVSLMGPVNREIKTFEVWIQEKTNFLVTERNQSVRHCLRDLVA
jgi:hypothetical protein